ncbi:MAG: MoaD/ThiS family protein [Desulfurococcales archaeon]|nr:MoaD/ThiS family protein [Desulfurococcales archaeon]
MRVRLRGIIADEVGMEEIKLRARDLHELLHVLEESIPNIRKVITNSRPKAYICVVVNGSVINITDPIQMGSIKLSEEDTVEIIPIAGGG